jgi:tetratricopeptide (TPR) repeat protein
MFKGELMGIRSSAASVALIAGLGFVVGCGQISQVRTMKAFKDGNKLYAGSDYRAAASKYEEALLMDPNGEVQTCQVGPGCVFFYLGNSYDNMYRPARKGEPANDALLEKAIANYKLASEKITQDEKMRTLSLEYLVAAYGPDKLNDPTQAEPVVKRMIEISPKEPTNYFALGKIYEDSGEYELAEQTYLRAKEAKPNDPEVYTRIAAYYNRQGDFGKLIEYLNEAIKLQPRDPTPYYTIATYYWDKAYRDFRLSDKDKMQYVNDGLAAVDKAIELKPDYMEAITYRGLLLRAQALLEKDPAKQKALLQEADKLRDKADQLRKAKAAS